MPKRRFLKGADAEDDLWQKIGLAVRNNILPVVAKLAESYHIYVDELLDNSDIFMIADTQLSFFCE